MNEQRRFFRAGQQGTADPRSDAHSLNGHAAYSNGFGGHPPDAPEANGHAYNGSWPDPTHDEIRAFLAELRQDAEMGGRHEMGANSYQLPDAGGDVRGPIWLAPEPSEAAIRIGVAVMACVAWVKSWWGLVLGSVASAAILMV